jgi:hypothetical protein
MDGGTGLLASCTGLAFVSLLLLTGCRAVERDLPVVNLWYIDTLVVHNRRLAHVVPSPSGSYTFLESAELQLR